MKTYFVITLLFFSVTLFSQNWTSEEQEILERVKLGWSTWEEAVNTKDYSIHHNAMQRPDDFRGWWM